MAKITSSLYRPWPPNIVRQVTSPRGESRSRISFRSMAATDASRSLDRPPTIHRPVRPGHPPPLEPTDHEIGDGLARHERRHRVEAAAVAHEPLDRVEPPLPPLNLGVVAQAVLQESSGR